MKKFLVLSFLFSLLLCFSLQALPLEDEAINDLVSKDEILVKQIGQMEEEMTPSPELNRYQKEYLASLKDAGIEWADAQKISGLLSEARIVLLSDEHTMYQAQTSAIDVLKRMVPKKKPVTLVLEWIDRSFQGEIDKFLDGKADISALKKTIRFDELWGFSWNSYRRILLAAKQLKVPVLLVDSFIKHNSLSVRDDLITSTVAEHSKAHPGMRYLVVYGVYHLMGKKHLSDKMSAAGLVPDIILVGEAADLYWKALKKYRDPDTLKFLHLKNNVYYIRNGSPLERHYSYRDYLMKFLDWDEDSFDFYLDNDELPPIQYKFKLFD